MPLITDVFTEFEVKQMSRSTSSHVQQLVLAQQKKQATVTSDRASGRSKRQKQAAEASGRSKRQKQAAEASGRSKRQKQATVTSDRSSAKSSAGGGDSSLVPMQHTSPFLRVYQPKIVLQCVVFN